MKYKLLGQTGVHVSELCFGTMSFGDIADEEMSEKMFNRCLDAGINFFDCANGYAGGRSEEILGKLMKPHRDELVITSKVFFPQGDDINQRGSSRRHITLEIENSLRRLDTDRLDVYFIHNFDKNTPIEQTLRALDSLVQQGKILYPAVSNWAAWQVAKALGISAMHNLARIEVLQPMYSLVKRQAEVEILPMAQSENIAVIPYSPLGGGLLTGKYRGGKKPDDGRLVFNRMYSIRYGDDFYYDTAEKFVEFAESRGMHPVSLAVAWAGAHPGVTAPIIGARNLEQLEPSLAAVDIEMTEELWQEVGALSYTPAPANDRLEEQKR